MYLIQRISDGKWYTNRKYSWGEECWISDKLKCRPFMTIGGAKTSRGWIGDKSVPFDEAVCRKQSYVKRWPGMVEHYRRKGTMRVPMLPEELPYRIVKLEVC